MHLAVLCPVVITSDQAGGVGQISEDLRCCVRTLEFFLLAAESILKEER